MKKYTTTIRLAFALVCCICLLSEPLQAQKTFDETLDIHLNAIRNASLADFEPTVSDSILHITPMGDKHQSKPDFIKVHEDWFKRNNWEWEGTIVMKNSTDSLGYALIRYTYLEKDPGGKTLFHIQCYLTLIFSHSEKGWQLVYDQNTIIPEKK
jgi:hypothetical protein